MLYFSEVECYMEVLYKFSMEQIKISFDSFEPDSLADNSIHTRMNCNLVFKRFSHHKKCYQMARVLTSSIIFLLSFTALRCERKYSIR